MKTGLIKERTHMNPLILIRHGHAEHLTGELTGGWTDTELTELGRRQAEALASRLEDELADASCKVYCSDLKRAAQTAEIIADTLGLNPTPALGLRELNNGIAAGMTKEEARRHYREPTEPLIDWQCYPGAETWRQFYGRVSGFMTSLPRDRDGITMFVTHGGTIVNIVAWWLRLEIETLSRVTFRASPASISVLGSTELSERAIFRLNDAAHLHARGLTDEKLF